MVMVDGTAAARVLAESRAKESLLFPLLVSPILPLLERVHSQLASKEGWELYFPT
jgi:hypothetical protein